MLRKYLLFIICFISAFSLNAQNYVGTEFRFSFLKNLNPTFNTPPIFDVSIHALEDLEATVEYGNPGDSFYQIFTINIGADDVGVVSFDQDQFLNQETLNVIETRSFKATTTGEARVYATHNRLFFAEATAVLPSSSLGTDYYVMSFEGSGGAFPSLFSIVATEDDTEITVVPTSGTLQGAADLPFTLNLNAGNVITISSSGDLTGSRVTSNGPPIAVFGGHQQSINGSCGADSHLYEEMIPVENLGTQYPIVPVFGAQGDLVRILAIEDGTEVFLGCQLLTNLNAGDIFEDFFEEPGIISSNQPILVGALTPGNECSSLNTGDPNLRIVLPLDRGNTEILFQLNNPLQEGFVDDSEAHFVHLVIPTSQTADVAVNGNSVNTWNSFPDQPNISVASVPIPDLDNLLTVESPNPFWAELISLKPFDALTFSFGSDALIDLPPANLNTVSLGPDQALCQGESIVLDPGLGVEGTWQDGSIQETFEVFEPGIYSVFIEDACGDGTDEVVISEGFVPSLSLPEEIFLCDGNVEDQILETPEETGVSYVWNTGEEGNIIVTNGFGTFTVTATSSDGCISSASTVIAAEESADVIIEGPSEICPNSEVILTASASEEGSFLWDGEFSGSELTIDQAGSFSVLFTPLVGCETEASFQVTPLNLPVIISQDTTICGGDVIQLSASSPNGTVFWPGLSESPVLEISEGGVYEVAAENDCGVSTRPVTIGEIDCTCPVFVPNAFTPNSDGLNDLFVPEFACEPSLYKMEIYNRWGSVVFETDDIDLNWNGNSIRDEGYFNSEGVYNYILTYDNPLRPLRNPVQVSGFVTLLR